jgi:putative ABC transport system substrate-binding protein
VRSNVELLFVIGGEIVLQAAVAASRTVPIVMWAINFDPIARGYVKSLAQPGGNITGIVSLQTELAAKQVELLTQALPDRTRLAILWDAISADQFTAAERQAKSLRLEVQSLKLENPPFPRKLAIRGGVASSDSGSTSVSLRRSRSV